MRRIKSFINPDRVMLAILGVYLIISVLTLTDYNEAWDNVWMYQYGKQSAYIYTHPFDVYEDYEYGPVNMRYFGPFLVTIAFPITQVINPLVRVWSHLDVYRLCYFLTYLIGVWYFYQLCKRFISPWSALLATALFISQPLFYGQAPVNPKDTTFLSIFITAVYFGLRMVDELPDKQDIPIIPMDKRKPLAILGGSLASFLLLYKPIFQTIITWAYQTGIILWLERIFFRGARIPGSISLDRYLSKGLIIITQAGLGLFLLAFLILIGPFFFKQLLRGFRGKYVLLAGMLFGFSLSVRILGLLIGGVILFAMLFSRPIRNFFYQAIAYTLTTMLTVYLSWPYLWVDPVNRFFEALQINLSHTYTGITLFNGQLYSANHIPASYVPTLIGVQFTIPLILLALAGFIWLLVHIRTTDRQILVIVFTWLLAPIITFMILRPNFHNGIRHSLFITPPLFLLAGIILDKLLASFENKSAVKGILILIILIPGLWHIIHYHPYEYIYFNQFVGGMKNGSTLFETDYLGLSLTEGIEYLNQNAEPNSTVVVLGQKNIATRFAREDLTIIDRRDYPDLPLTEKDTYLVSNGYLPETDTMITLYQVFARDIPLGTVQKHVDSE